MKKLLSCCLLPLLFPFAPALASALPDPAPATLAAPACGQHYDVVIGVGDKARLEGALSNAANLQKEFGPQCVNIEIVNYSSAVTLLTPMSSKGTQIKDALAAGVKIVACQNSMNKFKLTIDDMFPGITAVPSGVGELVKRQKEGWVYLQP